MKKALLIFIPTCFISTSSFALESYDVLLDAFDGFQRPVNSTDITYGYEFVGETILLDKDGNAILDKNGNTISAYGQTCPVKIHPGVDINIGTCGDCDRGEPVYSIANGRVIYLDDSNKESNWSRIVIEHTYYYPDGKEHKRYSIYGHSELDPNRCMQHGSPSFKKVKLNQTVYRGQQIGCIWDHSSDASMASHIHFEIRKEYPSHPDPTNGNYFCKTAGLQESKIKEMYENPIDFINKFYSYDWRCGELTLGTGKLCWIASDECKSGSNHFLLTPESGSLIPKVGTYSFQRSSKWYCNLISSYRKPDNQTLSFLNSISGGDYGGGPGFSTSPDPSETPSSGKLPDFITSKVTMGNKDGNHEHIPLLLKTC